MSVCIYLCMHTHQPKTVSGWIGELLSVSYSEWVIYLASALVCVYLPIQVLTITDVQYSVTHKAVPVDMILI